MVRDLVSPRHYSRNAFFIGAPRHAEAAITNLEARPSRAKSLGSVAESRPLSPAWLSRRFEIQRAQLLRAREEANVYHLAPIISLRCDTVVSESESTGRLIRAMPTSRLFLWIYVPSSYVLKQGVFDVRSTYVEQHVSKVENYARNKILQIH